MLDLLVSKPARKDSSHESCPRPVESCGVTKGGPGICFLEVILVILFICEVWETSSRWREQFEKHEGQTAQGMFGEQGVI